MPFEPVFKIGKDMKDSIKKMARVEELCTKFPGLDCGPAEHRPVKP